MVSLQYRLVYLKYEDGFGFNEDSTSFQQCLPEAVRLGLLAFTTTIFQQIAWVDTPYRDLATNFKAILLKLEIPTDVDIWKVKLWLLFVAALSVLRGDTSIWLKESLLHCLKELKLPSWKDTKMVLKEYLWVDMIHDEEAEKVFILVSR
jgi:hypothetical protein